MPLGKNTTAIFAASTMALWAVGAQANLLSNGDFDTVDARTGIVNGNALDALGTSSPSWDIYAALPDGAGGDSWTSPVTATNAGIEIQHDGTVVPAHSGDNYVELDSDRGQPDFETNSAMRQEVFLSVGTYELSFWYRPRTNTANDNRIDYSVVNGDPLNPLAVDFVTGDFDEWRMFSSVFDVTADGTYKVSFEAKGLENTLGGFIDTVSLTRASGPLTLVLAGMSLFSAGAAGRLRRRAAAPPRRPDPAPAHPPFLKTPPRRGLF